MGPRCEQAWGLCRDRPCMCRVQLTAPSGHLHRTGICQPSGAPTPAPWLPELLPTEKPSVHVGFHLVQLQSLLLPELILTSPAHSLSSSHHLSPWALKLTVIVSVDQPSES